MFAEKTFSNTGKANKHLQCAGSSDGLLNIYHVNPLDLAWSRVIHPGKSTFILSLSILKPTLDHFWYNGGNGEGYMLLWIQEALWKETWPKKEEIIFILIFDSFTCPIVWWSHSSCKWRDFPPARIFRIRVVHAWIILEMKMSNSFIF